MPVDADPRLRGRSRFDATWVPRIGPDAAAALRRSRQVAYGAMPVAIAAALGASFAFGAHSTAGTVLGVVLVVCATTAFAAWVRSRQWVAAAMSEWFEVRLRSGQLPSMANVDQFDAWVRKRNLSRADARESEAAHTNPLR